MKLVNFRRRNIVVFVEFQKNIVTEQISGAKNLKFCDKRQNVKAYLKRIVEWQKRKNTAQEVERLTKWESMGLLEKNEIFLSNLKLRSSV